ncbi:CIS tube protein [Roseateles amylovorans]|jgi:Contractile injection system tube protein|uniref:Peptidoglycan-binding protein n=1 Tax=Roseateles amylovorans TaxID=2978473 RepID=A0ABY6B2H7_9BURK|nr:peptidoglycan-binding protein [Roseateles amylovorans]UXH79423.1 peptidoglycan-binding protein [Roseateles amylovorans]
MPSNADGELTRLLLTRYSLNKDGTVKLDSDTTFLTQINPADFKHNFSIGYDTTKQQGGAGTEPKFSALGDEEVSFSFILDGTGIVPAATGQSLDVKEQLLQLSKVVYDYVELKAEPPYVRVLWGTLIFFGRLKSLSAHYTLFKPSGDPLRAKVDVSFVGAMSKSEEQRITSRSSSSELSKRQTAKEGDSLRTMCEAVYGDPDMAEQVARHNNMVETRELKPGQEILFPARA